LGRPAAFVGIQGAQGMGYGGGAAVRRGEEGGGHRGTRRSRGRRRSAMRDAPARPPAQPARSARTLPAPRPVPVARGHAVRRALLGGGGGGLMGRGRRAQLARGRVFGRAPHRRHCGGRSAADFLCKHFGTHAGYGSTRINLRVLSIGSSMLEYRKGGSLTHRARHGEGQGVIRGRAERRPAARPRGPGGRRAAAGAGAALRAGCIVGGGAGGPRGPRAARVMGVGRRRGGRFVACRTRRAGAPAARRASGNAKKEERKRALQCERAGARAAAAAAAAARGACRRVVAAGASERVGRQLRGQAAGAHARRRACAGGGGASRGRP
jgi:hypothetical protein